MSSPSSNKGNSGSNKNSKRDDGKSNPSSGITPIWHDPPIVPYEEDFERYLERMREAGGSDVHSPGPCFPSQQIGDLTGYPGMSSSS